MDAVRRAGYLMMYRDIAWLCRPAKAVSCAAGGKISRPIDTAIR